MHQLPIHQLTRWLLIFGIAAMALWTAAVAWALVAPAGGASAASETITDDLRSDVVVLSARVEELRSTVEWLSRREPALSDGVDGLSSRLSALSTRLDAIEGLVLVEEQPPGALSTHGEDRYNCSDFATWEDAQALFEANQPGDPNHIDMNRNGVACEDLRLLQSRGRR